MQRIMLKSKIHNATVTDADLEYFGSITIDPDLLGPADILPHERVQIVDLTNGVRLETYVIKGKAGSGVIGMNGPAAHLVKVGDIISILSFSCVEESEVGDFHPKIVFVDKNNKVLEEEKF